LRGPLVRHDRKKRSFAEALREFRKKYADTLLRRDEWDDHALRDPTRGRRPVTYQ